MSTRARKKITHRVGIAILVLVVFVVLGFHTHRSYQNRRWNHDGNFAILDIHDLTVSVYVPDRESIYTFILPKDSYVDVPGGYGTYKIQNTAELSFVETKNSALLERAITTGIGLPVSVTEDELTFWDHARIYLARSNYTGSIETVDLSEEAVFSSQLQPDGEEIFVVDPVKIAAFTAELLWERAIIEEQLAVGVFNASATAGLAANITHMLESMGVHVVDTTNWEEDPIKGTCVLRALQKTRNSVTLSRLSSVLGCRVEILNEAQGRFDIQVVLNDLPL